jgi:ribonuclease-3
MTELLLDAPDLPRVEIEALIGTRIRDIKLYQTAFTHKSALKKYKLTDSFETLEFMGDSVLGFIITKYLFDSFRDRQEGFLTKARTKLVRSETLAKIGSKLQLDRWILMDDKGTHNGWAKNTKVLEDVFEALVGAIYMDIGLLHAKEFVLRIFMDPGFVDMNCLMIDDNYKDILMRYCQANHYELPAYPIISHQNGIFSVCVIVNATRFGHGSARSKKQAEQDAAKMTLAHLRQI